MYNGDEINASNGANFSFYLSDVIYTSVWVHAFAVLAFAANAQVINAR